MSSSGNGNEFEEYREIGLNWRYWGDVRFKQLTAFLTVTAALVGAAVYEVIPGSDGKPKVFPEDIHCFLAFSGSVIAALFFILDERATYYRRSYLQRAIELERILGMWQYRITGNPYWTLARSEYVYRIFFSAVVILWALYIRRGDKISEVAANIWCVSVGTSIGIGWIAATKLQRHAREIEKRREEILERERKEEERRQRSG